LLKRRILVALDGNVGLTQPCVLIHASNGWRTRHIHSVPRCITNKTKARLYLYSFRRVGVGLSLELPLRLRHRCFLVVTLDLTRWLRFLGPTRHSAQNTRRGYNLIATDTLDYLSQKSDAFHLTDHRDCFSNIATSIFVPSPLQPVEAPILCDVSEGISVRIFAMKVGSVRGVRSSRLGSRLFTRSYGASQPLV